MGFGNRKPELLRTTSSTMAGTKATRPRRVRLSSNERLRLVPPVVPNRMLNAAMSGTIAISRGQLPALGLGDAGEDEEREGHRQAELGPLPSAGDPGGGETDDREDQEEDRSPTGVERNRRPQQPAPSDGGAYQLAEAGAVGRREHDQQAQGQGGGDEELLEEHPPAGVAQG